MTCKAAAVSKYGCIYYIWQEEEAVPAPTCIYIIVHASGLGSTCEPQVKSL